MILKYATIFFVVKVITAQVQNNSTNSDVQNSEFFQKFLKEFHKQYEELQKRKNVTTLPPPSTSYAPSTFSFHQNTNNPNTNTINTSEGPAINPANPYFTISPNFIRPTRKPHTNPFLRKIIKTTTQATTVQSTPIEVSTEFKEYNLSENRQSLKERFNKVTSEKLDTKTDFLSFVQSALNAAPKIRQQVSVKRTNSTQSVPNLVKKLVKIVPKPKIKEQASVKPEIKLRPRDDIFSTKSKAKNDYQDENSKVQSQNARYTFASDVQDNINGNVHQRHEQREGNKVTGMYTYEDGFFRRTVHYEADEKGYRVVKEDVQEIGNGPQINPDGSAKVKAYVAGNIVDYQVTNDDIYRKRPVRYQTVQDPQYYYSQQ